jgi:DNA-binding XRE family transcriptional regulator
MKQKNTKFNNSDPNYSQIQTILGADGKPAFVVIPYEQFINEYDRNLTLVPNEILAFATNEGVSAIRAWREHLGLSQKDLAEKMGISQAAIAQFEANNQKLRKATLTKIAKAMSLSLSQVNW